MQHTLFPFLSGSSFFSLTQNRKSIIAFFFTINLTPFCDYLCSFTHFNSFHESHKSLYKWVFVSSCFWLLCFRCAIVLMLLALMGTARFVYPTSFALNYAFNFSVFNFLSYSFRIFDQLDDECSSNGDCEAGLYCFSCPLGYLGSRCVRSSITDQFKLIVRSQFLNVKVLNMLSSSCKNSETLGVIQILVGYARN